jgi:transposase
LLQEKIDHDPEEQQLAVELLEKCEPVRTTTELARKFKEIVGARDPEAMQRWTEQATKSEIATEIQAFAEGLIRDWPSIKAAIELPWSNGRAEGHVNRIKLIKRKMYGRANFDLLRIRVLARGP